MAQPPGHSGFAILSPTAILGYGFPDESLREGMRRNPDLIAVDAGSTDPGPYYLGSGKSFTARAGVKHDLARLIEAQQTANIPLIIGSAGGAGTRPHLDWTLHIIREIVRERGSPLQIATIPADIPSATVEDAFAAGRIKALSNVPPLTARDILETPRIVAQMGHEPLIDALKAGFDIIICGRCYDPAVFAALPILQGHDPALALHMGKILECAAIAALPGSGSDCVLGRLSADHFVLEPLSSERRFTRNSVAAHSLYEKSDPFHLPGPGGSLDLEDVLYEELSDGRVKVSGTRFTPSQTYAVKLEGARPIGFRTVSMAGIRDPHMIADLDHILRDVEDRCRPGMDKAAIVTFHAYGKDGVMGPQEPVSTPAHEIGLVIDVVAPDQATADGGCALVRSTLLHFGFPGRLSTAGNLAFPYSPSDFSAGEVFEFSLYHLMGLDDPVSLFPTEQVEFLP
ncbi:MAG: acyclic terpene utilization AtuA family protein [Alphaproteobacteria bacterium]|nr:acyclic terpene utilization AtuA family protein [Alphaproteobacteria bacterium]